MTPSEPGASPGRRSACASAPAGCDPQSHTETEGSEGAINTKESKDGSEGKSSSLFIHEAEGRAALQGWRAESTGDLGQEGLPLPHAAKAGLIN